VVQNPAQSERILGAVVLDPSRLLLYPAERVLDAAHALREPAPVLVLGGLTRRHALVRHHRVR
jgi:hypothetical protein